MTDNSTAADTSDLPTRLTVTAASEAGPMRQLLEDAAAALRAAEADLATARAVTRRWLARTTDNWPVWDWSQRDRWFIHEASKASVASTPEDTDG